MVEFCSAVAKYQTDHGRFFLIENPATSSIWYTRSFTRLLTYHQAVTWDNLHMCAFGMKDPNGYYYYKPTSLMHNLDPKVIKPVFKRCPNLKRPGDVTAPSPRHYHQPVEGSASGRGSRTKLAQVYPYKFCQTLVDSLLLLGNPMALCTSTSLLCAEFFTDLSEQELKGLALALSERVVSEIPCFLETVSSLLQTRPKRDAYLSDALPVQDYHTRRALNKINSFPHATELDPSKLALATDLYYLRRKYIPHMTFQKAFVCRGTFAWPREKIRTCPGVVILWKKRDPTRLWICDASTLSLDPLIAAHWSAIFSGTVMDSLLLRNLFDLVLRVRPIRTHQCRRHHLPDLMSPPRLLFRMPTCHRTTQMLLCILMTLLRVLLMTPDLRAFCLMILWILGHLITHNSLVLPFPIRYTRLS